jgi:hypothetical protein
MSETTTEKKRTTQRKKKAAGSVETAVAADDSAKTASEPVVAEKKRRSFKQDDLISCVSVFPGSITMVGRRTKIPYRWLENGEVTEVEYQDINAEIVNKNSMFVYRPLFIIQDDDLIEQRPVLKKLYDSLFTESDIIRVLRSGNKTELREILNQMPEGYRSNVGTIASTLIQNGELDNLRIIKILDEVLGTDLIKQMDIE